MRVSEIIFIFFLCISCSLYASQMEEVVTKNGLKFLFVENHNLPKVSLRITFRAAGTAYESQAKHGIAFLTSLVMQEGSGKHSAEEFAKKLEDKGISLSFFNGLENFSVLLDTLSENLEEGIALLSDAIMYPKVNAEGLKRSIETAKVQLNFSKGSPNYIAVQEMKKLVYKEHPYAKSSLGTLGTITKITREDILNYIKRNFTKNNIVISVSGSVKREEIAALLDKYLVNLPVQKSQSTKTLPIHDNFGRGESKYIYMDVPQNVILFSQRGIPYNDPNYYNAVVLINALGGGEMGLNSLLMRALREDLAMTYGSYLSVNSNKHGNTIDGKINSNNFGVIPAIKNTLNNVKVNGIDEQLFQDTKITLINSYLFSMFTNENIVSKLDHIQVNGLDIKRVTNFADYINSVKLDEVNTLAKSLLDPENLFIVEVGKKQS